MGFGRLLLRFVFFRRRFRCFFCSLSFRLLSRHPVGVELCRIVRTQGHHH